MGRTRSLALLLLIPLAACGGDGGRASRGGGPEDLDHEPFFPIRSGFHESLSCAACHADLARPRRFDCLGCHKHQESSTRAFHAAIEPCAPGAGAGTCFAYESAACLACHPRGVADAPAEHDRRFPITGAAAHAGVACGSCHGNASDRTDVTCSGGECHASAEVTPQHEQVGGFGLESRLCERCHADGQVSRVADHRDVPISSGGPHFRGDCLSCHPQARADKPFGADFSAFACTGCHEHGQVAMDGRHRGLAGYVWGPQTCRTCHPSGGRFDGSVDHPAFPLAGSHVAGCGTCHTDAADQKVVSCSSGACHAAPAVGEQHAGVGGFAVDSALCVRCHADCQVDRIAAHGPLRLDAAAPHSGEGCLACHPQVRTDKPFGADFRQQDCLGCHEHDRGPTDAAHAGLDGYAYGSASCMGCHPDGTRHADVRHPQFPIADGSSHEGARCSSCHADPLDRKAVTCASAGCHAAPAVAAQHDHVGGFAVESRLCERCHADSQVDRMADHRPLLVTGGAPHFESACLSCHPQVRNDKPFGADFERRDCLSCHEHEKAEMDFLHTDIDFYAYSTASCLDCHADGTRDDEFEHPQFPIEPGSDHAGAGCRTCHADRGDHANVTCSSGECHARAEVETPHAHVGGFAMDSKLCERCHADGQVDRMADHGPLRIDGGAPHHESACLDCHPQVRADKAFGADFEQEDCLSCHEHQRADMDFLHTGMADYGHETGRCLDCHPDGARVATFVHPRFAISAGGDHDVACGTCHADRSDHASVTCSGGECHVAAEVTPQHGEVGGFDPKLCVRCHPDGSVPDLAGHTPFDVSAGGNHHLEACLECHPQLRKDDLAYGADFAVQTCTAAACHPEAGTSSDHAGVAGFSFDTPGCLDCHPTGAASDAVDHGGRYPIGKDTSHDVKCSGCHTNAQDRSVVTCTGSCHTQADMSSAHTGKVGGYQYTGSLCLKCHPDTPVFRVSSHKPFLITASGRHSACLTCHPSLRADRPFAAADFAKYDCLGAGCHSNETELAQEHRGRAGYAYESTTCTKSGCHPTGRGN